jgi:hypothetical protein
MVAPARPPTTAPPTVPAMQPNSPVRPPVIEAVWQPDKAKQAARARAIVQFFISSSKHFARIKYRS